MPSRPITRRTVLKMAGSALLAGVAGTSLAQEGAARTTLRIGTVFPARSGETPVVSSIHDFTGQGGRMGAILADERIGDDAATAGIHLEILLASSPSAEAARRAANRLVSIEEVHVLVGGIGAGQADAIAEIATAAGIPFLNVGSSSDALRQAHCGGSVFHVEPSDAMFLDAMVAFHASDHPRNWYVVHENDANGLALAERARRAIARFDPAGGLAGASAVSPGQPVYIVELNEIERSGADTILLLIEARDQIAFLGQQDDLGVELPTVPFPEAITQTRDYMAASRQLAPATSPLVRFSAWDVTLAEGGAAELNDRFTSRWGEVMNPTAWATYVAIDMAYQAVLAGGSADPAAITAALADPAASFDLRKGVPGSFRSWDHQLRHSVYAIAVDPDAPWHRLSLASRIGIAGVVAALPDVAAGAGDGSTAALDAFGDGPSEGCATR